jgi:hypothetical protein
MKVLDYTGTNHLVSKTKAELAKKVDKVTGKGLSTNDYTNAEKQKVAGAIGDAPSDGRKYARMHGAWVGVGGISSWEDLQVIAKSGVARDFLELGQVFTFKRDNVDIPCFVVDFIDNNKKGSIKIKSNNLQHGIIFQTIDNIYSLQFDSAEAFHVVEDALIPAGTTLHFTIPTTYSSWASGDYQFTLANDAPIGTQFCFSGNAGTVLTSLKVNVYASSESTTLVEQCDITSGNAGTSLGALNGTDNNHPQRISYGNNRWLLSAIRQQLNSDEVAGSVWLPQHKWDRPPSWKDSTKGFMNGLETSFTNYVADVEIDTYRNTVCDGGGLDTTEDKFFLAGRNELFMPQEGADNGVPFELYKQESISPTAHTGADAIRIKKTNGSAAYWWMRSPSVGYATSVRGVGPTGERSGSDAGDSCGVAPAFVIA